jgi:hypothetical protein
VFVHTVTLLSQVLDRSGTPPLGGTVLTPKTGGSKVVDMSPVATPERISDFFLRLADDPALLDEHLHDPRATMAAAGLTPGQIDTVLRGDVDGLRQAVEEEIGADPARRHVVVTPRMTVHTPSPDDPEPPPPPPEPERR